MNDEADLNARQKFCRDLRRVREDRGVSLAEVHAHTQVPKSRLEAFEEGELYEGSRMNPVYLRAFVRSYAEVLGLPGEFVTTQLRAALEGEYQNELAVEFLDAPPAVGEDSAASSGEGEDPGESTEVGEETHDEKDREKGRSSDSSEGQRKEKGPVEEPPEEFSALDSPAVPSDPSVPEQGSRPLEEDSLSPRGSSSSTASVGRFLRRYRGALALTAATVLVLVFLGVLVPQFFDGSSSTSSSVPVQEPTVATPPTDSVARTDTAEVPQSPERPPPADVSLGDTLHLTVHATSVVREMRVQQDDDLRRPYWIEEGEALVFPFTERITVENQLDSLRLFLEGYPYPTARTDAKGRIVIRRDTARQFVDTLRGSPPVLPVTPDTVEIREPGAGAADTLSAKAGHRGPVIPPDAAR